MSESAHKPAPLSPGGRDGARPSPGVRPSPAWSVLPEEWKPLLTARGLRAFRADQILQSLYRDWITDWDAATTLPKDFRETLKAEFPLRVPEVLAQDRAEDGTTKLLLGLSDGNSVETVVIPAKGRDACSARAAARGSCGRWRRTRSWRR